MYIKVLIFIAAFLFATSCSRQSALDICGLVTISELQIFEPRISKGFAFEKDDNDLDGYYSCVWGDGEEDMLNIAWFDTGHLRSSDQLYIYMNGKPFEMVELENGSAAYYKNKEGKLELSLLAIDTKKGVLAFKALGIRKENAEKFKKLVNLSSLYVERI